MNEVEKRELIKTLFSLPEGRALISLLKDYSSEVGNVSNIPAKIIELGGDRLSQETLARIIAKTYIDNLIRKLTPISESKGKKQIVK